MTAYEVIEQIEKLPHYGELYIEKYTTKPVEVDCGHDHLDFDTDDLKGLVAEFKKAVAGSNYTANDDTFPTEVAFSNGRKVGIAFDGDKPYLTISSL
jgi:hypothetical protein